MLHRKEKTMKNKLISIILALFLILTFTACGESEPQAPDNRPTPEQNAPEQPTVNDPSSDENTPQTQDLDNTAPNTFTPPDFTFVMDGITLGETKMNDVRAKHGGDDFWIHGEDIIYPIGTSLAYWFQSDYTSNNFVGRMGYADPALSWLFFEKYHVGDNASAILLDITGLSAVSSLGMGNNEVFNNGDKQIFVERYSDNQYHLYYIKGGYEAEIQIYDNIIIKVTMSPAENHHNGNGGTTPDTPTAQPPLDTPTAPSEYALTIVNNTGNDLYELRISLYDYANNDNSFDYWESTKNNEGRLNADGWVVYDGIILASGATKTYVLEGAYGGSNASIDIYALVGVYADAQYNYYDRAEGIISGTTFVLLSNNQYEIR
jgi:predicted small lipoprotein YifL